MLLQLYVHPVEKYLHAEEELSFYDVIRRARQKAEIVIGYQQRGSGRVVLNPADKATRSLGRSTVEAFVVLAESA